ncbi:unnamed protein product [Discosporangium mesarthrocarpum]
MEWVHDEKWFYVMKDEGGVYLQHAENKTNPRGCRTKRFITKYMFLAAVTSPSTCSLLLWHGLGRSAMGWFDGKIGVWPIVDIEVAKRNANNLKKGTPIMKLATVNRER